VPGRSKGPATVERTRSRGCGQDLVCKGDEVHRVSRRCEVATRVSPGAQLVHTESAAAAGCRKLVRLTGRKLRQLVQIQIYPHSPFGQVARLGGWVNTRGLRPPSVPPNHLAAP
jgi:hypothetical protein